MACLSLKVPPQNRRQVKTKKALRSMLILPVRLTDIVFLSKFHASAGLARRVFKHGLAEFVPGQGSTMIRKFVFVLLAISSVASGLPADAPDYHLVKRVDVGRQGRLGLSHL